MNTKTNLPEENVNFVDTAKKQNRYFKITIISFAIIVFLFLVYLLFKYPSEQQSLFTTKI